MNDIINPGSRYVRFWLAGENGTVTERVGGVCSVLMVEKNWVTGQNLAVFEFADGERGILPRATFLAMFRPVSPPAPDVPAAEPGAKAAGFVSKSIHG